MRRRNQSSGYNFIAKYDRQILHNMYFKKRFDIKHGLVAVSFYFKSSVLNLNHLNFRKKLEFLKTFETCLHTQISHCFLL